MSNNPYGPPSSASPAEEATPLPANTETSPAQNNTPETDPSGSPQQGAPTSPDTTRQRTEGKKPKNRMGLIALALSALGLILGLFSTTSTPGWLLLFTGLVAGIVGLFQKSKERITSILAIMLSVLGTIISSIVLLVTAFVAGSPQTTSSATEAPLESAATPLGTPSSSLASTQESASAQGSASEAGSTAPSDHQRALAEARDYIKATNFSYKGLYDQLTSDYGEKYSPEAAQYAMDHLEADWNAEALGSAQNHINTEAFSYEGLYEKLTGEGGEQYTPEQARYAVDNVKADWNAEALESARKYLDVMKISDDSLYDQLTSEYGERFTPEQARYAIDHL